MNKLEKPYTKKQKFDFIVNYNHNQGLIIEETDKALYALAPWEKLEGDDVINNREEYEAVQTQKERERIDMLSLTAADVERAIYKAKRMDFEDILELVRESQTRESQFVNRESGNIDIDQSQTSSTDYNNDNTAHESRVTTHEIDLKALKIELKANNFYRGNPYIEQVGALLGFTPQMLDEFFETGDYTKLAASAKEQDSNAVEERVQNAPFDINTESEGK